MSADTEAGREAEAREHVEAIAKIIIEYGHANYRQDQLSAALLAERIYLYSPDRCDYDCDKCRE